MALKVIVSTTVTCNVASRANPSYDQSSMIIDTYIMLTLIRGQVGDVDETYAFCFEAVRISHLLPLTECMITQ